MAAGQGAATIVKGDAQAHGGKAEEKERGQRERCCAEVRQRRRHRGYHLHMRTFWVRFLWGEIPV